MLVLSEKRTSEQPWFNPNCPPPGYSALSTASPHTYSNGNAHVKDELSLDGTDVVVKSMSVHFEVLKFNENRLPAPYLYMRRKGYLHHRYEIVAVATPSL